MLNSFLRTGITGRAVRSELLNVRVVNLHDFGMGNYKQIDDYVFGSGGMLLAAPQLKDALNSVLKPGGGNFVAYPSPQGILLNQEAVESLALQENLIIICGRYEGIDDRFISKYVDLEFSIGDCVLTGGEIPAMALIDAVSRLIPGVVGKNKAVVEDSFYRGMLDNPNYTRPEIWENMNVPEILLTGNQGDILKWRRSEAVKRTLLRRPDLISRASVGDYLTGGIYLSVLKNFLSDDYDFKELENLCSVFGISRPFLIAGDKGLRYELKKTGTNAKIVGSIKKIIDKAGADTLIIKIYASKNVNSLQSLEAKRKCLEHSINGGAILFLFADDENELDKIPGTSAYLFESPQDLSLNNMISIALDRFLGRR